MEKVVNLSAFGDIIENPDKKIAGGSFFDVRNSNKKEEPEQDHDQEQDTFAVAPDGEEGVKSYSVLLSKILQNSAQIKLLHWQTLYYGQHKALDSFYESFGDLSDKLAEVVLGKFGKQNLTEDELCLCIYNYKNPENSNLNEFLDHLYKCYDHDCKAMFSSAEDPEIMNILDEITGLIDQYRYLLRLK
jgi:hypothetical protein